MKLTQKEKDQLVNFLVSTPTGKVVIAGMATFIPDPSPNDCGRQGCSICNPMKLRETLSGPEAAELINFMRNEPVEPGQTISHHTAAALHKRGLAIRTSDGWRPNWDAIRNWPEVGDWPGP
jgi:hypothetical protein